MNNKRLTSDGKPSCEPCELPAAAVKTKEADDTESARFSQELARRAYFNYLNDGAPQGRDLHHWLDAEAHLLAERNRNPNRPHGYHN